MSRDASLAEEIGHVYEAVKDIKVRSYYSHEEVDLLLKRLLAAQKLAHANEMELAAFRHEESRRYGRAATEQLATDAFGDLVLETAGNVIRPDFRGPK